MRFSTVLDPVLLTEVSYVEIKHMKPILAWRQVLEGPPANPRALVA